MAASLQDRFLYLVKQFQLDHDLQSSQLRELLTTTAGTLGQPVKLKCGTCGGTRRVKGRDGSGVYPCPTCYPPSEKARVDTKPVCSTCGGGGLARGIDGNDVYRCPECWHLYGTLAPLPEPPLPVLRTCYVCEGPIGEEDKWHRSTSGNWYHVHCLDDARFSDG